MWNPDERLPERDPHVTVLVSLVVVAVIGMLCSGLFSGCDAGVSIPGAGISGF